MSSTRASQGGVGGADEAQQLTIVRAIQCWCAEPDEGEDGWQMMMVGGCGVERQLERICSCSRGWR